MKLNPATASLCFQPWYDVSLPEDVKRVPALLHQYEKQLLYYIAKNVYSGWGCVVDAGCFVGGSTSALAGGLRDNVAVTEKAGKVIVFDRFVYDARWGAKTQAPLNGAKTDEEFYQQFRENVQPFESYLDVRRGDLLAQKWEPQPIEVYALDVAKTWLLMQYVMRTHFPSFRPGTVLYHQDFFDVRQYYLPFVMSWLAPYFQYLGPVESQGALFICTNAPSIDACQKDLKTSLSHDEIQRMHQHWAINADPVRAGLIALSGAAMMQWLGDNSGAFAAFDRAVETYGSLPRVRSAVETIRTKLNHAVTA